MRKSMFLRVFGGHLTVVLLLMTATLLFLLNTVRNGYVASMTRELEQHARTMADRFEHDAWPNDESLDEVLKRLGHRVSVRFTITDPHGRVIADSHEDPALMEDHSARPELIAAVTGELGSDTRYSRTLNSEMLYVAVPLVRDGQIVATVRAATMMSAVNRMLRRLATEIAVVTGLLLLLALALSLLIVRDVTRPVNRLVRAARRVGRGELELRVPAGRDDELGELSDGFNEMVARLQELVAGEKNRKEMLDKVIGAMHEGLVVFDSDGRLTLVNPAFTRITGVARPEGKFLWEVVREPALAELARMTEPVSGRCAGSPAPEAGPEARNERKGQPCLPDDSRTSGLGETARVVIAGRSYLCAASRLASSRETVITFHDVTEIEHMAEVKRDLVVNASHELRTPLTAMKCFLETLAGSTTGEELRYVEIISRHVERLTNIVRDLLVLSQVEDGPRLEITPVAMEPLVADILRMFERRAHEKNLELRLESEPDLPPVAGDQFHLEQVIINLIDNAIKYTDAGRVLVRLAHTEDQVRLEIEDTGIGIPADQLPRLYERFFVADKARSRKLGGTGLGLAIVKHIVHRHGGTIRAISEPSRGSRFIVTLPTA